MTYEELLARADRCDEAARAYADDVPDNEHGRLLHEVKVQGQLIRRDAWLLAAERVRQHTELLAALTTLSSQSSNLGAGLQNIAAAMAPR